VPGSGDDVGQKPILDFGHPVLQDQLSLFQPLNPNRVDAPGLDHSRNGCIEIAVLLAQLKEFAPEFFFLLIGHPPAS
jgi:hypothetical protein